MDWLEQFDGYCERTDFTYWSEPVNAVTNIAFLIAAVWMWRRVDDALGRALCGVLFAIGVGSYLFHTHATVWAVTADVLPIFIYILMYIYIANRYYWNWPVWLSLLGAAAFIPYTAALTPVINALPFFRISGQYWGVALLIAVYGILLRKRHPETATGLIVGAALLTLSLTFRSVDELVCSAIPWGTHFMWHILNGVMLGWMIEVYRRHRLAAGAAEG